MVKLAPPNLICPDPRCPNHDDTGDNNRFRGVQKGTRNPNLIDPRNPKTFDRGFTPEGDEQFYCYACGKEAVSTRDNVESHAGVLPSTLGSGNAESHSDALLPSAPQRPIKSGDDPQQG